MAARLLRQWAAVAVSHMFLCPIQTAALSSKRRGAAPQAVAGWRENQRFISSTSDLGAKSQVITVPSGGVVGEHGMITEEAKSAENQTWLHKGDDHVVHSRFPAPSPAYTHEPILVSQERRPARNHRVRQWYSDPRTRPYHLQRRETQVRNGSEDEAAGAPQFALQFGDKDMGSAGLRNLLLFGFVVMTLLAIRDWIRFAYLTHDSQDATAASLLMDASSKATAETLPSTHGSETSGEWSAWCLVALTSYRFYTGFLSATWLPYLLAMEGSDLYSENQSLFMGVAKLIYGVTILTNPFFGLIGDRVVTLSHGIGRRLFLRAGMIFAGLGICICMLADAHRYFLCFVWGILFWRIGDALTDAHRYFLCFVWGILFWRIGDALTDVTVEALVPELVPASQYAAASAAKSTQFLLGGVCGYVMLIVLNDYRYTWLYWAYAVGMVVCSIPCQVLLSDDSPLGGISRSRSGPFLDTLKQAYLSPAELPGWFPRACLAVATFSFGTSPMFFLLLLIRDLVGSTDPVMLNRNFSTSSIIFFVSAAVATVIGGLLDQRGPQVPPRAGAKSDTQDALSNEALISRLTSVVYVASSYAAICILLPTCCLFETHAVRISVFYFFAMLMGYCFGSGFARFQDITWQLIPNGSDVANCMGFNIMCRLFGVGTGNFAAGVLLDFFEYPQAYTNWEHWAYGNVGQLDRVYAPHGYVVMCGISAAVCLVSSYLCYTIAQGIRLESDLAPVPAA